MATLEHVLETLLLRLAASVVAPAATIVLCLYIFNAMGDVKYLPASAMAYGVGFFVMYLVFKYIIKPDASQQGTAQQLLRYFIVFIVNLAINLEIMYLLVTHADVPLFTAQMVAAVIIAYESYYAYLSLLYRARKRAVVRRPRRLEDEIVYYDELGDQIQ